MHFWKMFSVTDDLEKISSSWRNYIGNISVSFGLNPFSDSGAIAFTRFLWPSLTDLDL